METVEPHQTLQDVQRRYDFRQLVGMNIRSFGTLHCEVAFQSDTIPGIFD